MTRSNKTLTLKRRSSRIYHHLIDLLQWSRDYSTIEYALSSGKYILREERRKTERLLTQETPSIEIGWLGYLEDGELLHMSGALKESATMKVLSERILKERNWQCGLLKLTNSCFTWHKWKIKSSLK